MTYELWAVYSNGREELLHSGLALHEAELACNELNLASTDLPEGEDVPDYRICPEADPYDGLYVEYTAQITG